MNKIISTISLSKRAGKLVLGYDAVKESVLYGEASMVFITKDLSAKTEKNLKFLCNEEQVDVIKLPAVMDEIWAEVGKRSGIIVITDKGLANKLKSITEIQAKEELHAR